MGGTNNRIRLNTIKIFMLLVVIVGIFFIVNTRCFAEETGYSFVETKYDIDNIKTETFNFDNFLIELLGFNFIYRDAGLMIPEVGCYPFYNWYKGFLELMGIKDV